MLDAALDYAARNWAVVPIRPGEKRPAIDRWTERATTDPDLISAWWRTHPTHGVGIATGPISGLFVLDVDGEQGADTLRRLEAEHGELPHTYTVATGSGGAHYYFRTPRFEIRNDASKRLGPKLDIRGAGGQVVAPPTVHPNGTPYRWTHGDDPVDAPDWLLELLRDTAPEPDRTPTPSPEGDRPGDRFNTGTTWAQLLEADGWTLHHTDRTGEQHWTRPGKDRKEGTSATVGYQGLDVLHVFTSSVKGLDPEGTYSRFAYYTATRHDGDYIAAAKALGSVQDAAALDQWLARTATAIIEREPIPTVAEVAGGGLPRLHVEEIPDPFVIPPIEFLVTGLILRDTYGEAAGENKSLKSTTTQAIVVGGALGEPVLGQFAVPKPFRSLVFTGEGGRNLFLRRLERMTAGYGATIDNVRPNLRFSVETAPVSSARFLDTIKAELDASQPELVVIDPWYSYASTEADARNLYETGAVLNNLRAEVCRDGASLIIVNHFNQTGSGGGLTRISMAGHAEWVDSWWLFAHRQDPNVDGGSFRLNMDIGSRQWGGSSWHLDYELGEYDDLTGAHIGDMTWAVNRKTKSNAKPNSQAKILEDAPSAVRALKKAKMPLARGAFENMLTGNRTNRRSLIDALVYLGCVKETLGARNARMCEYVREFTHDDADKWREMWSEE